MTIFARTTMAVQWLDCAQTGVREPDALAIAMSI
jgi:hypothetical protein